MPRKIIAAALAASLSVQTAFAGSLGVSMTAGENSEDERRVERKGVVTLVAEQVGFSLLVLAARIESANENASQYYFWSEKKCSAEESAEPTENTETTEAKKAEPAGPEPFYFGF